MLELLRAVKKFEFAKDLRHWKYILRMHETMCLLLSAAHLEIDRFHPALLSISLSRVQVNC